MSTVVRVLTDALVQGVIVLDEAGAIVHANPAAERRFRVALTPGRPVRGWLTTTMGLSPCAVDRLLAGETVRATPPTIDARAGQLRVSRVLLPNPAGAPWIALVLDDRRGDARVARLAEPASTIAASHDALWAALVAAIERAYDQAVALAVFTVEIDGPAEAGAVCRALSAAANDGDVVGFVAPGSDPTVLAPGSICAAIVSPDCMGFAAADRRRALADTISGQGWSARVGAAALRLDTDAGGSWDAAERATALIRRAIATARPVGRAQRRVERLEAPSRRAA